MQFKTIKSEMDNLDIAIERWVALKQDMKTPVETKFIIVLGTEVKDVTYVTVLVGYEYIN